MKIYTKTGDKGTTALVGGTRVSKADTRVEAYGTVDELISHLALLRSYPLLSSYDTGLEQIQSCLMILSAQLASDGSPKKLPEIKESDIQSLEVGIDQITKELPLIQSFIIAGPPAAAAQCHIARCICRRAERLAVAVESQHTVNKNITPYLNRLSDYLFVLSRKVTHEAGMPENFWLP